ncbi:SDR family oxidoreductase [Brevirhabdus sp.]|uniref:SDR family oxidoreductase n=1 Tax=Brevirhabdus sp. TaxID=2004514 RepID=UPI00405A1C39
MTGTLFSFGHGYSAQALADVLIPCGWTIIGTTRSADKARALTDSGVTALLLGRDDVNEALERASHLLICAGPDTAGDPLLTGWQDTLARVAGRLEWAGYLSTTGVYGDHGGAWVDEDTPLTPGTRRGQMRVQAETAWQRFAAETGLPLHIFRLAGIYGPGRGPFAKVLNGTARRIVKPGQVFSRIHVEDIAQVLAASIARPDLRADRNAIYNLCDDDAAPPQDVIAFAAELLGVPVPPEIPIEQAEMTPMASSFYAESKRVRNDRIKHELGVALKYPDYRSGLRDLLAREREARHTG